MMCPDWKGLGCGAGQARMFGQQFLNTYGEPPWEDAGAHGLFLHVAFGLVGLGSSQLANEHTRYPVRFEFQINDDYF